MFDDLQAVVNSTWQISYRPITLMAYLSHEKISSTYTNNHEGPGRAGAQAGVPASPLLAVLNVTAHPYTVYQPHLIQCGTTIAAAL